MLFRIEFSNSLFLLFSFSRRAVNFRRQLSEASLNLEGLQKLWDEGKREAIAEKIKSLESVKEEDKEELVEILDCHFDPEKKTVKPVVVRRENNERNNQGNNDRGSNNGNGNTRNGNARRRRGNRGRSPNKENQGQQDNRGPRSNSRRKSSTSDKRNDKRFNNNNNNNNEFQQKNGDYRKMRQNVDMNQNAVLAGQN